MQLITMIPSDEGEIANDKESQCQIRVFNTKDPITVPASLLLPCTTTNLADIPIHSKDFTTMPWVS
eukprot:15325780-Ditylum_brightwellii.AAC.1